ATWGVLDGKRFRTWGPIQTDAELHLATLHFQPKGDGVEIQCRGCQKPFISKGLRCCTTDCERKYRERVEIAAVMDAAGMERSVKRPCQTCGAPMPRYEGVGKARRLVPMSRRFCGRNCREKWKRQQSNLAGVYVEDGIEK